MALGKRRTDQDENEIDMTPMLDVVFIMLIFFIVTASFVNEVGLGVNRPPTTDQPPPNTENTNIVFRIWRRLVCCWGTVNAESYFVDEGCCNDKEDEHDKDNIKHWRHINLVFVLICPSFSKRHCCPILI